MAGDKYAPVRAGEQRPPSATVWNELLLMLADWKRNGPGTAGGSSRRPRDRNIVLVRNDSETDVGMYGILGLSEGFVIAPSGNLADFQNAPIFKGVAPTLTSHRVQFVVTLEPIADGEIGRAVISGMVPCLFDVSAVAEGALFASIVDDTTTHLKLSHAGLFPVKSIESGTGTKWGIVEIGGSPSRLVLGKTDAAIALTPGNGTVSLYAGTKGSETDTTENITAVLLRYSHLDAGEWCHVLVDETGEEILIGDPC